MVYLSQVSIAVTGDVSCLTEGVRYAVATTDGAFTGAPDVTLDPSLANWHFQARTKKLTLSYNTGLLLIFR